MVSCLKTFVTGVLLLFGLPLCYDDSFIAIGRLLSLVPERLEETAAPTDFLLESVLVWWKKVQKPLKCFNSLRSQNSIQNTWAEVVQHCLEAQDTREFFKEYMTLCEEGGSTWLSAHDFRRRVLSCGVK